MLSVTKHLSEFSGAGVANGSSVTQFTVEIPFRSNSYKKPNGILHLVQDDKHGLLFFVRECLLHATTKTGNLVRVVEA